MLSDSSNTYGRISKVNHWLFAIFFIGMLILGLILEDMARGPDKRELMGLHKSIGFTLLFFALWRVAWRIKQGFLKGDEVLKAWEAHAARAVHILLLLGLVAMPLSGYLMSTSTGRSINYFGLFEIAGIVDSKAVKDIARDVHGLAANMMMALIGLHIAAAIKHHFVDKNTVLRRMLGR